ncbi:MAG TPA: cation acetate symporter [Thermoleophilaceae bacterium]|nr:cation acetate symporter [Thermoleophilaceae bacterium]
MIAVIAVSVVTIGTLGLGTWAVRFARTTSDLFVASRAITPWWNAAAVSGEYLSAASFLGIAGLVMKLGTDALWLSVGFTAGYLTLLLFVAAPLRRFGSFTISDFVEARLGSPRMRLLAATIVLGIAGFYLVPQLKGAGITLNDVTGAPYWVGVVVVGAIVAVNVGLGGMRGITYVQAVQFWIKTFAIAMPACLLLIYLGGLPQRDTLFGQGIPRAPASGLTVTLDSPHGVTFPRAESYTIAGEPRVAAAGEHVELPAGKLVLPPGAAVPLGAGGESGPGERWSKPVGHDGRDGPLFVYSLLIATVLGTMGLPHILVRFYTNPDGPAARRTTVRVLGLLGVFYLFPLFYGFMGRALAPGLYVTGETDSVVLRLPHLAWPGTPGNLLSALTAAGAFAAFLSTASGLLVSIAGTLSYDIWGRVRGGHWTTRRRRLLFRLSAVAGIIVPVLLALAADNLDIGVLVGWAFAIAASSFCPMFLLGIWWRGLTARGAAVGMIAGAGVASAGIFAGLITGDQAGAVGALLSQPAVVSVPVAFISMIAVSLLDAPDPVLAEPAMLALHAPEGLGLEQLASAPPHLAVPPPLDAPAPAGMPAAAAVDRQTG